jgi:ParB-like chromosome segregation protein Spo0J
MADRKLEVVMRPVEALVPYAKNSRTHSDAQVAQLAGSVREFGWTNPVLLDESGGIIAGHGRVLAARKLAMTEVPCIVLTGLSDQQRRAYVLADNKLALNAGWDAELLALELQTLVSEGVELDLMGFDQKEFDALLGSMSPGLDDSGFSGTGIGGVGAAELNPDGYEFEHRCPKCGFEFSGKQR